MGRTWRGTMRGRNGRIVKATSYDGDDWRRILRAQAERDERDQQRNENRVISDALGLAVR